MATIQEMKNNMTIFYNKRLGIIKCIATGIQTMDWFEEEKEDYKLIIDYIVVPNDIKMIKNIEDYIVKDGELISKTENEHSKKIEQVKKEKEELENQLLQAENNIIKEGELL